MRKKILYFFLCFLFTPALISFIPSLFADEAITITTYYPSPYGSYNDLYVANKLGIGTTSPGAFLDIQSNTATDVIAMFGNKASVNPAYPGYIYIADTNTINSAYNYAADGGGLYINYAGYQNGSSYYRNFHVNNGKAGPVLSAIGSTGNVGIGTTSPSAKLHVQGQGIQIYDASSNIGAYVKFLGTNSNKNWLVGNQWTGAYFEITPSTAGGGTTFSSPALVINNSGNVGIGTASPEAKLNVRATASDWNANLLQLNAPSTNYYLKVKSYNFADWHFGYRFITVEQTGAGDSPGTERDALYLRDNGYVGIGTTAPSQELDVVGDLVATGSSDGTYLGLFKGLGGLPGYASYRYPTVKTDYTYMYFSVAGAYSSYINSAGTYTAVSDRAKKENFVAVNLQDILARIDSMPMYQWNFKNEAPSVKHIAPVAQDFYAAFGLNGKDDKMISHIDPSGVALVGVKALSQKVKTQQQQIQSQEDRIMVLEKKLSKLKS